MIDQREIFLKEIVLHVDDAQRDEEGIRMQLVWYKWYQWGDTGSSKKCILNVVR